MAKATKQSTNKKRGNYDAPLKTKGSFMDFVGAVVKDAKKKDKKKP